MKQIEKKDVNASWFVDHMILYINYNKIMPEISLDDNLLKCQDRKLTNKKWVAFLYTSGKQWQNNASTKEKEIKNYCLSQYLQEKYLFIFVNYYINICIERFIKSKC